MAGIAMTREDDERDLDILAHLRRGVSRAQIARKFDMPLRTVSRRIEVIRTADCAHDPEAIEYWSKR